MSVELEHAVARALIGRGVDCVFGIMGMGNLHLISELVARDVHYVSARHENGSVSMADAWARVSGGVGICTVTRGPGLTNTLTSLVEALKSRVPVVLFVGEAAIPEHPQNWPHRQFVEGAGIEYFQLDGADVETSTGLALDYSMVHRRPIVVELRARDDAAVAVPIVAVPRAARTAGPTEIQDVLALIRLADRPVILAGRGAVVADARAPIERLAELSGALLATTAMANGMFSGNPRYVGVSGGFSSAEAVSELAEADLVIAFGASLNQWTLRHGWLYPESARFVQVDSAESAPAHRRPVDLRVVGDAGEVAEAMADSLEGSPSASAWPASRPATAAIPVPADTSAGLHPELLCRAIAARLPEKRTIAIDSGHFFGFAVRHLRPDNARAWVFSQAFLSLGLGVASSVGAATARPGVLGVAVCGDGGTLMSLGEIDTAVRENLPLLIVIMNDHGYGAEVHELRHLGIPEGVAQFNDVDFAGVARALGGRGEMIADYDDLDVLDVWLADPQGPLVLDCKIDPSVKADWMHEQHDRLARA